jgi:hypothetical protein
VLGAVGRLLGDGVVGRAARHSDRAGVGGEPVECARVELYRDHVRAVAQKAFDHGSADAAPTSRDDDGPGRTGRRHIAEPSRV